MHFRLTARALLAAVSLVALNACGPGGDAPTAAVETAAPKPADNPAWPQTAVADPATLGVTAEGLAALDARLAQSVADQDVAGMTAMLVKGGDVAFFKSYGQATDATPMANDSIFRIYSMTKPITGLAMMQLFEQGKWKLDDPVTAYAPELANLRVLTYDADGKVAMKDGQPVLATPSRPPTMREIMTHTAGFGYGLVGDDPVNAAFRDQAVLASANLDEMMQKIAGIPLQYEPGQRWSYSVSVDIQGYIVEKLSGQKLGEYMKTNIFTPLGMGDTAFYVSEAQKPRFADVYRWDAATSKLVANPERPDRPGFTDPNRMESGGGGLISTTHDYARFCQMMLNKGELAGNRVLKAETIDVMTQNHIGDLKLYSDGTTANPGIPGVGFGMDYAVYGDTSVTGQPYGAGTYYWGGAAGTWFWIDPVNDLFFIGMIQNMGGRREGAMDFRNESAKLVYGALAATATQTSAPAPAGH
jgi:CubicO group peptidase (beta-lactamase class C family)